MVEVPPATITSGRPSALTSATATVGAKANRLVVTVVSTGGPNVPPPWLGSTATASGLLRATTRSGRPSPVTSPTATAFTVPPAG